MRGFMVRSQMLDWRLDAARGRAHAEEVEIPAAEREGLRRFMSRSGIVCGSFDFAVDQVGSWWFLEVNESGQFLWIDHMMPEAGVFQDFLAFITGIDRRVFAPLSEFSFDYSSVPKRPVEKPALVTMEG